MKSRVLLAAGATASLALATVVAPATVAGAAASRPAPVTNLAPFEKSGPVTLAWANPREIDRDVVRLARGAVAPRTAHSGRAVALPRPRAARIVLRTLVPGRQYSVSVWTERDGVLSRRASTSFTTKSRGSAVTTRTGVIAGTVVDSSGDPLRDAVVLVVDYDTFNRQVDTTTDRTGAFRLTVPRGRYFIAAIGSAAKGGPSDATGYVARFKQSPVHTGQAALKFVLAAGGALTGTVTDSHGAPLRRLEVGLFEAPAYLDAQTPGIEGLLTGPSDIARTDGKGRFHMRGIPAGAWVPCFAAGGARGGSTDARGYLSRCDDRSAGIAAGHLTTAAPVALASVPRAVHTGFGSIAGTVIGVAGKPVARTPVVALDPRTGEIGVQTRTDSSGHFALHKLAPHRWGVCAERGDKEVCKTVAVEAHHTAEISMHFRPSGSLSGVVRGPSGDRLANAEAILEHRIAGGSEGVGMSVDPNGEFTADGLAPGRWRVCFSGGAGPHDPTGARSGCIATQFDVITGRDRIGADKTLAPGGAVAGTVTDSSGDPVRNAGVVLYRRRSAFFEPVTAAVTDAHGAFRAAGLDPGRYRVCGELDYDTGGSLDKCAANPVVVAAKRVTTGVAIALPADSQLTAKVTDAASNPLSGVDVAVLNACRSGEYCTAQPVYDRTAAVDVAASAVTNAAGTVRFHGLRPGRYTACALAYYAASTTVAVPETGYADKCAGSTFSLQVTRGGIATTTLRLDPGAAVSGLVRNGSGKGLAAVAMHVAGSAAFDYRADGGFGGDPLYPSPRSGALTGPGGRYAVRSVAPGSRKVCGVPPSGLGVRRSCLAGAVDLAAGTTTGAPTLTLADSSARGARASRVAHADGLVAATPLSFLRQRMRFLPATGRIPVINSAGMPEFRTILRR